MSPLGTTIEATLWSVRCRYRETNHGKRPSVPNNPFAAILSANAPPDSDVVTEDHMVATADPSGAGLYEVTRAALEAHLGRPVPDLALVSVARVSDSLRGLARVTGALG